MAQASRKNEKGPKRTIRKQSQTVRQRTQIGNKTNKRRIRTTAGKLANPLKKVRTHGKKEFHPIRLPDNKLGRLLGKRVKIAPRFLREAWQEIRLVTWPNRKDTLRLTMAVFIFSVVFAAIVGVLDYVLDKIFREVIIGK